APVGVDLVAMIMRKTEVVALHLVHGQRPVRRVLRQRRRCDRHAQHERAQNDREFPHANVPWLVAGPAMDPSRLYIRIPPPPWGLHRAPGGATFKRNREVAYDKREHDRETGGAEGAAGTGLAGHRRPGTLRALVRRGGGWRIRARRAAAGADPPDPPAPR